MCSTKSIIQFAFMYHSPQPSSLLCMCPVRKFYPKRISLFTPDESDDGQRQRVRRICCPSPPFSPSPSRTGYLIRYVTLTLSCPRCPELCSECCPRCWAGEVNWAGCLFKCYTNLLSTDAFHSLSCDASPRRIILEWATCPRGGSLTHLRHIWRAASLTTSVRALRTRRSLRQWNWDRVGERLEVGTRLETGDRTERPQFLMIISWVMCF